MSIVDQIQEQFNAGIVYGEPIESGDSIVVPAARVAGGGGGGSDTTQGEGGGFGLSARPVGAWVIRDGEAEWQPTIDVSSIVLSALFVAWSLLFFSWRKAKAKARAQR